MYRYRNTDYQKKLLGQDRKIFKTADLAVLWEIKNENSLWMTIQRYIKRKILYSIQRGVYSVQPIGKLNPFELGCAVAGPFSYVSGETVLQKEGIVMQKINKITLFGLKKKQFNLGGQDYWCRYLNFNYLMNRQGINDKSTYSIADLERALADILHINPNYYVDNQIAVKKIKISTMQERVGYK